MTEDILRHDCQIVACLTAWKAIAPVYEMSLFTYDEA